MKKTILSNKVIVYCFDELENFETYLYFIEKKSRIYLIDTFCGPESLKSIIQDIEKIKDKELVIINTHFHWDHIWGNCCFENKNIISHELCRKLIDEKWECQIERNSKYLFGEVKKVLPNVTFKNKLEFHDDKIEIFYSPGHTKDSISIFDHENRILYAGDNLEKPIIYVEDNDIDTYIRTLENYLRYKPNKIYAAHNLEITINELKEIIKYLKDLKSGKKIEFDDEYRRKIHQSNFDLIHSI